MLCLQIQLVSINKKIKFVKQKNYRLKNLKKSLLICFLALFLQSKANTKTPTLFEENNGQLSQISLVSNKVLFQANLPNLTIWITEKGLIYNFYQVTNKNKIVMLSLMST